MLLAVDVGNSHTTFGVFADEDLRCELRLSTRRNWTCDEVAFFLHQMLQLKGIAFDAIDDAVVAAVVPPAVPPLLTALQQYFRIDPLVIGPGVRTGVPIRYDPPQDVGADRIVTAVAAHALHASQMSPEHGALVVDFGTATTFDVVSPKPEYLGGVIAPGVGISADALFTRAAKLPRVEPTRPPRVIGKNTVHAIQSGIVYGYVSLVEGLITRIRSEIDWPVCVIGTGGFASTVAEASSMIELVDDALVLKGLRLIHARNRGKQPGGTR